ncbi:MAG: ABC transporter substrate-binding protein [Candidatus Lustribacter sp.]
MIRRRALQLLAGSAAAVAASPVSAQNLIPIRVGTFASEATGSIFYAQDQGFLAKHGLTAQINLAAGGAAIIPAIIGGDLDMGEADVVTMALAHDKGLPFQFVAPGELHSNKYPTLACVVKNPALQSGRDFNGKTMASNVSRGFGSLVTNVWIDNNGGDSKTVKWIEFPFPALSPALQRGDIDGYCAPEPFVDLGVKDGGHLVLLEKNPVAPEIIQGGWFAGRDWIKTHPSVVNAFSLAIREANDWANQNPDAAAAIISKYSKVPVNVLTAMKMRGQYQAVFTKSTMQPLIDAAFKYGYIAKPFPVSDIIANT